MPSPFDFASLLSQLQLNRLGQQPLGLTGANAPVQLGQVPSVGLQQPGLTAEAPKMPGVPGQGGLMGVQQPSLAGVPQMGQAPQMAAPSMAANVAQPGQVDQFLGSGAPGAALLAGKPDASKAAPAGGAGAGMAGLAALPLALGATQVRGVEGGPNPAQTALNAQTQANTASAQGMANANPNVNPALQHRNASQALMQANLQAGAGAASAIEQREIEKQQAQQQRIQMGMQVAGQAINTAGTAGAFFSDVRLKENIQPGNAAVQQTLDGIQPHTFDAPALGQQGTTGIMAQQLAQTPAGSQLVQQDPQSGMLAVDGQGATQFALAGLGDLNARIRQLEETSGGAIQQMAQADQATRPQAQAQAGIPPQQAPASLEGATGLTPPPPSAQPSAAPAPAPQIAPPSQQVTPQATQSLRDAILERVDQSLRQNLGFDPISQAQGDSPAFANNGGVPDMSRLRDHRLPQSIPQARSQEELKNAQVPLTEEQSAQVILDKQRAAGYVDVRGDGSLMVPGSATTSRAEMKDRNLRSAGERAVDRQRPGSASAVNRRLDLERAREEEIANGSSPEEFRQSVRDDRVRMNDHHEPYRRAWETQQQFLRDKGKVPTGSEKRGQSILPNGSVIQPVKDTRPGQPAPGTPQDDFVQVRNEMRAMLRNLPPESTSARDVSEVLRMMDPVQDPFALAPDQLARMVRMAQAARDASSRGVPMSQVMQEMGIGNDRAAGGSSPKAGGR